MTNRYDHLVVALDNNTREDDAEALISAIRQLKGVLAVEPHVDDGSTWTAEQRVRHELVKKLNEILCNR